MSEGGEMETFEIRGNNGGWSSNDVGIESSSTYCKYSTALRLAYDQVLSWRFSEVYLRRRQVIPVGTVL